MKWLSVLGTSSITSIVGLSACLGGHDVLFGDLPATGGTSSTAGTGSTGGSAQLGTGGSTQYTVDANTVITLKRDLCYGTCPAYTVTVRGNGSVTYQGTQFVKVVGVASEQISVSDVQALVDQMIQANYFGLSVPSDCPDMWTDNPTYITSLTLAGQTHSVEHYLGNKCAPTVLIELEDRIDEITNSAQWVKCDTTGYCTS